MPTLSSIAGAHTRAATHASRTVLFGEPRPRGIALRTSACGSFAPLLVAAALFVCAQRTTADPHFHCPETFGTELLALAAALAAALARLHADGLDRTRALLRRAPWRLEAFAGVLPSIDAPSVQHVARRARRASCSCSERGGSAAGAVPPPRKASAALAMNTPSEGEPHGESRRPHRVHRRA